MSDAFWLLAGLYVLQMVGSSVYTHLSLRNSARNMKATADACGSQVESYRLSCLAKDAALDAWLTKFQAMQAERDAWAARYGLVQTANDAMARRLAQYEGTVRVTVGDQGSLQ